MNTGIDILQNSSINLNYSEVVRQSPQTQKGVKTGGIVVPSSE